MIGAQKLFNFVSTLQQTANPDLLCKVIYGRSEIVEVFKSITPEDIEAINADDSIYLRPDLRQKEKVLKELKDAKFIIIPFHANSSQTPTPVSTKSTSCLLVMEPEDRKATLYEQKQFRDESVADSTIKDSDQDDTDNDMLAISDQTVEFFETLSLYKRDKFSVEDLNTQLETIEVSLEEDFMVAMAYIADCLLFERNIDCGILVKNMQRERQRMVDMFVRVIKLGLDEQM